MATPYVGEIRMFAGNFAPLGWLFCDGQLVPISEFETLFNLIGTTYGGDGEQTFALPNITGRVPLHTGSGPGLSSYLIGETGGSESVTLNGPQSGGGHTHQLLASLDPGTSPNPAGEVLATGSNVQVYALAAPDGTMSAGTISTVGGGQPHENLQPYLAIRFIISLFGVFPSPT